MTWARIETSSAETASSSRMHSGLVVSARARATRWRWPPRQLVRVVVGDARPQPHARQRRGDPLGHLGLRQLGLGLRQRLADRGADASVAG